MLQNGLKRFQQMCWNGFKRFVVSLSLKGMFRFDAYIVQNRAHLPLAFCF